MALLTKAIYDWETIMLDTSVIINLFIAQQTGSTDPVTRLVDDLISGFSNRPTHSTKKPRTFLVSSVSVSEILGKEVGQDKIMKILKALNSNNVEFVDFDVDAALIMTDIGQRWLGNKELHRFAKEIGWMEHELILAREWITRDHKIIACGIASKAHAILTCDRKTFFPIAKQMGAPCAIVHPDTMQLSSGVPYQYNEAASIKLAEPYLSGSD